jgi:hypothetical protein
MFARVKSEIDVAPLHPLAPCRCNLRMDERPSFGV